MQHSLDIPDAEPLQFTQRKTAPFNHSRSQSAQETHFDISKSNESKSRQNITLSKNREVDLFAVKH